MGEMGFSAENLEDFTAAADIAGEMISNEDAAAALNGLSNAAASASDDGSSAVISDNMVQAAGAAAQGVQDEVGGVKGKKGGTGLHKRPFIPTKQLVKKNYKRISAGSLDTQFGDNFTTSQRAGILLYWIHTLRTEQE